MALAFVYRHRNGGNNSDNIGISARVYNGQLLFFTGEVWPYSEGGGAPYLHRFIYRDYSNSSWTDNFILSNRSSYPPNDIETVNSNGDRIYVLPRFNRLVYGSGYAYGSGSHYGLRRSTSMAKPLNVQGTSWETTRWLDADHRIIINGDQGFTRSNSINTTNLNYVRCWGYMRPNGQAVETFGEYVHINFITNNPGSYALHTR
ncbi:hypothetical protein [Evansella halocellulosilytica]|uniref:hypothetical protein n=1 Tax=Evansella halocellulosilytica TaxID=2011013 RepID=UPI000BB7B964|nr:hypothetical protein [Evansella halocellulosilytica]